MGISHERITNILLQEVAPGVFILSRSIYFTVVPGAARGPIMARGIAATLRGIVQ